MDDKEEYSMKRFLAIFLAAMLLVAVMPVSAFASGTKTVYISRNGSGQINLRKGAGYDYGVTGNYVYHNNKVEVLKTSGKWSKVKVKSSGKSGWIRTYYIDGTTKSLGTGTHKIKKDASVHSKASSSSSKVGEVEVGDTVKVYYTERDYASVTVSGSSVKGWIPMSCIGGVASTKVESPSSGSGTVYRVKATSGLHLRTKASKSSKSLRVLPNGTAFTVKSKSGNWYKIKVLRTGEVGWVSKSYTTKHATATVTTYSDPLRVRTGPSTSKTKVGSLKKGAKVTVKNQSGSWFYITYGSLKGWSSRYASGHEVLKFIG